MVKVGDKVRIVSVNGDYAGYKNGEVLEVISFNIINPKNIYVRTNKDVGYTGAGSDRPIQQPFAYLIESEYEVVPDIRKGDTVRLIDKFYEHEVFKKQLRSVRKSIASLGGKVEKVNYIFKDRASVGFINCTTPLELLERVESTKHRYTAEQIAEAERIIGEIVAGFCEGECFYLFSMTKYGMLIRYTANVKDCMHTFTSRCSPNDEFSKTIGILVALCKATGRKLPEWI